MVNWKKTMMAAAGGGGGWISYIDQTDYEYISTYGTHAVDDSGYTYVNLANAVDGEHTGFLIWTPDGDLEQSVDDSITYNTYISRGISACLGDDGNVYFYGWDAHNSSYSVVQGARYYIDTATRSSLSQPYGEWTETGNDGNPRRINFYNGLIDSTGNYVIMGMRMAGGSNNSMLLTSRSQRIVQPPFQVSSGTPLSIGAKPNFTTSGASYPYGDTIWWSGFKSPSHWVGRQSSGGTTSSMPGKYYTMSITGEPSRNAYRYLAVDSSDNCYIPKEGGGYNVGYIKLAPSGTLDISYVHEKAYDFAKMGTGNLTQGAIYDPDTGYVYISGCCSTTASATASLYSLYVFAIDTNGNYQGGALISNANDHIFSYSQPALPKGDSLWLSGWGAFAGTFNTQMNGKIPKDFSLTGTFGDWTVEDLGTPTVTNLSGSISAISTNPDRYGFGSFSSPRVNSDLGLSYVKANL